VRNRNCKDPVQRFGNKVLSIPLTVDSITTFQTTSKTCADVTTSVATRFSSLYSCDTGGAAQQQGSQHSALEATPNHERFTSIEKAIGSTRVPELCS
jgi:hypothetical protein